MFNKLKVKEVKKETNNTVSIAFEIPSSLESDYKYSSGQYVTIKSIIDGEDVRRAYSLCSSPFEDDFRIGVKKVEGGKMSSYLNDKLSVGEEVEMMAPVGGFVVGDAKGLSVAFAAGSGITPILSMIKSVLNEGGKFSLFYGNKSAEETIFKSELDALKIKYSETFNLHYIYSRESAGNSIHEGRIDKEKALSLLEDGAELLNSDGFYMCGPEEMISSVSEALKDSGVDEKKIHFELFTAPTLKEDGKPVESDFSGESQVTVIMDGDEFEFPLRADGDFILDVAIENGADAPFSCKGAVCCTCKAQVIEGKAIMDMNYSLSEEEVEEGFILTCQARPASDKLTVDYDVS